MSSKRPSLADSPDFRPHRDLAGCFTFVTVLVAVLPLASWDITREGILTGFTIVGLIWYTYYTSKSTDLGARSIELLLAERRAEVEALAYTVEDRLREIGRSLTDNPGPTVHCSVDELRRLLDDLRSLQRRASALQGGVGRSDRQHGLRMSIDWAQRALGSHLADSARRNVAMHLAFQVSRDTQDKLACVWDGLEEEGLVEGAKPIR